MTKAVKHPTVLAAVLVCTGACKPNFDALSAGQAGSGPAGTGGIGATGHGGSTVSGGTAGMGTGNFAGNVTGGGSPFDGFGGNAGVGGSAAGFGAGASTNLGGSAWAGASGAAGLSQGGTAAAAGTATTVCEPIAAPSPGDALKLKYDFDSTAGDIVIDASGNAKDGSLLGAATWSATGRFGGALTFSAANQYVQLPQDVVASMGAVTIAAWVKLSANPTNSTLFDFGSSATNHLYLRTNGGTGISYGAQVNGGPILETSTSYVLPPGVWKHLALAVGDGLSSLYIDGTEVTSRAMTFAPSALGSTAGNWIGHSQTSAVNLYGSVDDFRIYDRALGRREVESIAPPGTDYAHFSFDESCGTMVHDRSSKALVAELPSGGTWTAGRVGGGLALNGTTQFVQLPANLIQQLPFNAGQSCGNDLTVALWIQRTKPANFERLFSFGLSTQTVMTLTPWTTFSVMQFAAKLNGGASRGSTDEQLLVATSSAVSPQSGLWGHVAVVLQSGTGHLYFNGQEVGNGTISVKPSDLGATVINAIGQPLYLGEPYLAANIDDLRISCRAFPPSEIKILALTGQ